MKINILYIFLFLVLVFQSCDENPLPADTINCSPNQTDVDGECITNGVDDDIICETSYDEITAEVVCDNGCYEWDNYCYHLNDIDVLIDLRICSDDFDETTSVFNMGNQIWDNGRLVGLNLYNDDINCLPLKIGNLTSLEDLDLRNNNLTALPSTIGNLANLKDLDLRNNNLTALPSTIGNLTSLEDLDLENNELSIIPETISNLDNLVILDLSYNELAELPTSICELPSECYITVYSNALCEMFYYDCITYWGSQNAPNCDCNGVPNGNVFDGDNDNVCDDIDICPNDYYNDADGDEICGDVDICPNDYYNDADGDGLCADDDICPYDPFNLDNDGDYICDDDDTCPNDYYNDADGDGLCGDVDICPNDYYNDADGDGLCADDDICPYDPLNECSGCTTGQYDYYISYDNQSHNNSLSLGQPYIYYVDMWWSGDDLDVEISLNNNVAIRVYDSSCNLLADSNEYSPYCESSGCYNFLYEPIYYVEVYSPSGSSINYNIGFW